MKTVYESVPRDLHHSLVVNGVHATFLLLRHLPVVKNALIASSHCVATDDSSSFHAELDLRCLATLASISLLWSSPFVGGQPHTESVLPIIFRAAGHEKSQLVPLHSNETRNISTSSWICPLQEYRKLREEAHSNYFQQILFEGPPSLLFPELRSECLCRPA